MKRRVFLASGLALCAPFAHALAAMTSDELVRVIAARIAQGEGVRARFMQTRTLAATSAPSISRGRVIVARDVGIVWSVSEPYQATYVIGKQGIVELDASGARIASRRGGAGAAQESAMARALASGDLSMLYAQFEVHASGTPQAWRLLLEPSQPQIAQAIRSVRLEGGAQLQRLQVVARNGDATLIELTGSMPLGPLSDAERALFEVSR
jgi:hypothetical protein